MRKENKPFNFGCHVQHKRYKALNSFEVLSRYYLFPALFIASKLEVTGSFQLPERDFSVSGFELPKLPKVAQDIEKTSVELLPKQTIISSSASYELEFDSVCYHVTKQVCKLLSNAFRHSENDLSVLGANDLNLETVVNPHNEKSLSTINRKLHNLTCELSDIPKDVPSKPLRKTLRAIAHQTRKIEAITANDATNLKQQNYKRIELLAGFSELKKVTRQVTLQLPEKLAGDDSKTVYALSYGAVTYELRERKDKHSFVKFYCFDCKNVFAPSANKRAYKMRSENPSCELFCRSCESKDVRVFDDFGHLSRKTTKID